MPLVQCRVKTDGKFTDKFKVTFDTLCFLVNQSAIEKGFWENYATAKTSVQECAVKAALIHGEVSEFVEAIRLPTPQPDKHLPHRLNLEVELADIIIRTMDLAQALNIESLAEIILEKINFNKTREPKHGKVI